MNQKKRKLARGYSADELSSMWDNKNDKDGSSVPAAASLQATVADPSLTRPLRIMTIEEPEKKPAVKGTAHAQSVIQEQAMAELKSRLGAAPFTLDSPLGDTMRNSPVLDDRMLSDDEDLADAMPEPVSPLADPPAAPEVDTLGVLSNHAVMHHRRNSRRISQEIAKESLAISIEELPTSRKIAPVWRQFLLCTKRSLIQQQRTQISFLLEIFVSIIASMAIGAAVMGLDGELFRGYFIQPYTILSSAPMTSLLPLVGLLIGVCASISAAPAAVKVFGEEQVVGAGLAVLDQREVLTIAAAASTRFLQTYWKDMAAGHSRMAYFFSKMVTSTLRLLITSIHFAGVLYIMGKFSTSFSDFYAIVMLIFFCAYGVSFVVSLLVRRENGTLLAVMVCLVFSILNGFGPSYYLVKKWGLQWLWGMSYGLWATEALYGLETRQYEDLYDIPMSQYSFSFELWRHDTDINALIAIGMVFRVLTYLLLRFKNRDKQM